MKGSATILRPVMVVSTVKATVMNSNYVMKNHVVNKKKFILLNGSLIEIQQVAFIIGNDSR